MAQLPLEEGIPRFKVNEERVDMFTNGTDSQVVPLADGTVMPSIRKFMKDKGAEIDVQGSGWLAEARDARDEADGAAVRAEGAASAAAADANAQIAPAVSLANVAADRADDAADDAREAADAAIAAGTWDYRPLDNAALAAITGMTSGQTAYVRLTMRVWRYDGSAWVDTGENPLASKANEADLVVLRQSVYATIPGNDLGIVSGVFVRSPIGEIKALIAITEDGVDIANRTNDAVGAMIGGDLLDAVRAGVSVFIPENDMGITDGIFWQSGAVLKANRYVADGISVSAENANTPISVPAPVEVCIAYGASLTVGALATPAISTGLSKWGKSRNALMLSPAEDGPRTFTRTVGGATNYGSLPLDYWTGLTGLKEVTAQSIWPSFADAYLSSLDAAGLRNARLLCSITGLGSATYDQLKKGTSVYNLLMRNFDACRDMARQAGGLPFSEWITTLHGQAHSDTGSAPMTPEQYEACLVEWLADLRSDVGTMYGQPARALRMCFGQVNRAFATGPALAQLSLHKTSPDFMLTGPQYHVTYVDGVHPTNVGQSKLGDQDAKYRFLTRLTGRKCDPLMITSYNLSGNNLDLTYNNNPTGGADHPGPIGPLVRDGGIFVSTPTGGVDGFGTEASLTGAIGPTTTAISSVTITSATTVRVTFASAPIPGQALNIGLRNCTGLRIRDSDDRWKYAYDGAPIHNHAVADRIVFA